jgi:pilus assembly protein Flp/PilA
MAKICALFPPLKIEYYVVIPRSILCLPRITWVNDLLTTEPIHAKTLCFIVHINLALRGDGLRSRTVPDRPGNNGSGITLRQPRVDPKELKMTKLIKFVKDESGATAIEYGLIAAGISVAIIAVVQGLGSKLNTTFTSVQTALK